MRTVPFFDYKHSFVGYEDKILEIVKDVGRRGAFIMQSDLSDFEESLSSYIGAKNVVGVGNATDAMEMALTVHGVSLGDEVLVSAHTMIATASAVAAVRARPVPVDIGDDYLLDPDACVAAITPNTKAIIVTQLNGRTANMDRFQDVAEKNGLMLFEDSAQGLGSKFRNQAAGTFGIAGCFSFYPAKILGSLGDGGAIICNDSDAYERYLMMRDHGRGADGDVHLWGRNSRLDNLQAAILNMYLADFDKVVARRREIASIYQQNLGQCEQLQLPPAPSTDESHFDAFQNYELCARDRDGLKAHLSSRGIGTLIQWGGKGLHQFSKLGMQSTLTRADKFFRECLMLPMNTSISDDDVAYVSDAALSYYE